MLLTADLHLREESADVVLREVIPGILDLATRYDENTVAILGDLWHLRYRVPVSLLNAVAETFEAWGLNVVLLPGNHDQVDVYGRNAMEVLGALPNVEVFSEPTVNASGAFLPYRKDPGLMVELSQKLLAQAAVKILYTHAGVRGAAQNGSIYDADGIPLEALVGWDLVVTGHYHRHQRLGNVVYLGSPWETRADEAGDPKGVWRVPDFTTYTFEQMERIETRWGPKHYRFELGQGETLDLSQVGARDIVRVATAAGVDVEAVGAALVKAGVKQHTVTPEVAINQARLEVAPESPMDAYAQAYAEIKSGDLALEGIVDVFKEIKAKVGGVA